MLDKHIPYKIYIKEGTSQTSLPVLHYFKNKLRAQQYVFMVTSIFFFNFRRNHQTFELIILKLQNHGVLGKNPSFYLKDWVTGSTTQSPQQAEGLHQNPGPFPRWVIPSVCAVRYVQITCCDLYWRENENQHSKIPFSSIGSQAILAPF